MMKIIDKRGTGKSSRLLLLAKQDCGTIVCSNPSRMEEKALLYGITGIEIVDYETYINKPVVGPIYVDDVSKLLKYINKDTVGYSDSWDGSEIECMLHC